MHIMCFTERPYYHVPEEQILKNASHFGVPNTYFDPVKGSELYNTYLDEAVYAEEMGFDGIMLNEHHGTPFTLGAVMDVEAAILASARRRELSGSAVCGIWPVSMPGCCRIWGSARSTSSAFRSAVGLWLRWPPTVRSSFVVWCWSPLPAFGLQRATLWTCSR